MLAGVRCISGGIFNTGTNCAMGMLKGPHGQAGTKTRAPLDGEVKVCRHPNCERWQATFKIDAHWSRISAGKRDLTEAKAVAGDQYLD